MTSQKILLVCFLLSVFQLSFSQELLFTSTIGGENGSGAIVSYNLQTGELKNSYSMDANPLWGGSYLKADYDFGGLHMGSDGYIYGLESSVSSPYRASTFTGALYRFHPDSLKYEVLHSFSSGIDSEFYRPAYKLVETEPGVFYGICERGGSQDYGGIWKYTLSTGKYEEIGEFNTDSKPGNHPASSLVFGPEGDLYGVLRRGGDSQYSFVSRTADVNGRFTRKLLDPLNSGILYKVDLEKDSVAFVDNLNGKGTVILYHGNGDLVYRDKPHPRLYGAMRWSIIADAQSGGGAYAHTFDDNDPLYANVGFGDKNRTAYLAQITQGEGTVLGESFANMVAGPNGKLYIQSKKSGAADRGALVLYDGQRNFTQVAAFSYYTNEMGTMAAGQYLVGTYSDIDMKSGVWIHNTQGAGVVDAVNTADYGDVQPFMAYDGGKHLYLRTRFLKDKNHNQGYILKLNLETLDIQVLDTLFAPNGRYIIGSLSLLEQDKLLFHTAYGGGTSEKIGNLGPTYLTYDLKSQITEDKWRVDIYDEDAPGVASAVKGTDGNYYMAQAQGRWGTGLDAINIVKMDSKGSLLSYKSFGDADAPVFDGYSLTQYDSLKFLLTTTNSIVKYDENSGQAIPFFTKYNNENINPNGRLITTDSITYYGLTVGIAQTFKSDGSIDNKGNTAVLFSYKPSDDDFQILLDLGKTDVTPGNEVTIYKDKIYWLANEVDKTYIYSYDLNSQANNKLALDKATQGSFYIGSFTAYKDKFYATSYSGGTYGQGVLLEFDPATEQIQILKNLTHKSGKPFAAKVMVYDSDSDSDGVYDIHDQCSNTPAGEAVDANGCSESQKDDDGDGVANDADQCANSPAGETVDANGCAPSQKDTDGDGLNDKEDHCPNTPAGETVDQYGCSANQNDGDGDGVLNADDQCPNTPAGETVDANGCSDSQKDTDGDGVNDADDHCANTPAGETVDVHGCSPSQLDGDGDGVSNALDQCPNTPAGEAVDANGCGDSQKDDDGDGVMNNVDQCANTPTGEAVDADGCGESQKDDDGDGVFNTEDHCPGTAAGETVDVHGCTAQDTDGDGDGVLNQFDKCPNTPAGAQVNSDGCADSQLDSDNDGITDDIDVCPNTTAGLTVNATGCADNQIDTDGDGVYDAIDHCDNTPAGETADAHGCSPSQLDVDNDGVTNDLDQCPSTPLGSAVNAQGCSTGQLDTDGDGVTDNNDQCPNTPAGEIVDINGCSDTQKDGDSDGVNDALDHCPNTSSGTTVDVHGCAVAEPDGDGDGVPNANDQCPNTPAGATVDANGCSDLQKDTDGDGVENSQDVCPSTPAGEQADFTGCSPSQLDSDRDGVHDDIDQCPNTVPGEVVDAHGCSPHQLDDDNDNVPNDLDQCTNTPPGTTVNGVGCTPAQTDSDNDGVFDDKDLCPNTPTGESVNADGCSNTQTDADADGVVDAEDHCSSTPAGEVVDVHGCSPSQIDSDGDGVPNASDLCPNTPAGTDVNSDGCPAYSMAILGQPTFEDTPLGLISTSTFEILNSGSNDGLSISSIDVPEGFSVDVASLSLNAGEAATVTVSFQPTESRTYSGTITINSTNVNSQSVTVSATGAVITEIPGNINPNLISISPNPVSDYLTIELNNLTLSDPQILIYDISGLIKLKQDGFRSRTQVIDVRGYSSGIYLIRITGKEGELIKKFIRK